jgi:predicted SprT family Zn-dependent metalloprotease
MKTKKRCWGFFNQSDLVIGLANRRPSGWPLATHLLEVFAHEFCHYERYRNGREQNERGIDKRALAMVRRFMREVVC